MFSFYAYHDSSFELRTIRLVIEKTKDIEGVELYIATRETVAAHMSVDLATTCLDDVYIQPNCLAQLMLVVFDKNAIKKTRLLENMKARSEYQGMNAGEMVTIILVDFLKVAENNFQFNKANKVQKQDVIDFMETAAKSETLKKLSLLGVSKKNKGTYEEEEEEEQEAINVWKDSMNEKSQRRSSSVLKTPIEDRIDRMVKKAESKRSKTPSHFEAIKHSTFIDNKVDKIGRVNYIAQQKSKAEDRLVKAASLLKKSNKDYNELLVFASNLHNAFSEVYRTLVTVQESCPGGKVKLSQFPVKKKVVESYNKILELKVRSNQNELAPILEYFVEDKLAMKGLVLKKEKGTQGSDIEIKVPLKQQEFNKENVQAN